jgi:hypothetical protein
MWLGFQIKMDSLETLFYLLKLQHLNMKNKLKSTKSFEDAKCVGIYFPSKITPKDDVAIQEIGILPFLTVAQNVLYF